jgi:DNA helicase-2/ATP-dependent DNA helicase PcrA
VEAWLMARLSEFESLPYMADKKKNPPRTAAELAGMLRTRASVADMVGRYAAAKRSRGALDFGDLVALAAKVAQEVPLAAQMERQRYKVVLLDEFQDTSFAQLVLFSRLFGGGHAVTAVGDPNQSIYGSAARPPGSSSTSSASFRAHRTGGFTRELGSGADVLPDDGLAERAVHPGGGKRDVRVPGQVSRSARTGRRGQHARRRRGSSSGRSALAAQPVRGAGHGGRGALWNRC